MLKGGDRMLKRRIYLNDTLGVNLYGTEGGPNTGNCASGCTNCSGGDGGSGAPAVVAAVITATALIVVAALASNPDEA